MILNKIIDKKILRIDERKAVVSLDEITKKAISVKSSNSKLSFSESINKEDQVSIIAEVKKASPSKGIISGDFLYKKIAVEYEQFGAAAISVLTEEDFFLGSDKYLTEISNLVKIPTLRKDFIVDEYQIFEAKVIGASAILLICRVLSDKQLIKFYNIATDLGLDCLFEAHTESEVQRAFNLGAKIIGVNNRDLDTFEVNIKNTEKLIKGLPSNIIKVSESGIDTAADVKYLSSIGVNAILVGESLMRADSIKEKLDLFKISGKR